MQTCVCVPAFATLLSPFFPNILLCEDPLLSMGAKTPTIQMLFLGQALEINKKINGSQQSPCKERNAQYVCMFAHLSFCLDLVNLFLFWKAPSIASWYEMCFINKLVLPLKGKVSTHWSNLATDFIGCGRIDVRVQRAGWTWDKLLPY